MPLQVSPLILSHIASQLFSHASVISHIREWATATSPKGKKQQQTQKWCAHSVLNCRMLWLLNYLTVFTESKHYEYVCPCGCAKYAADVNKVYSTVI